MIIILIINVKKVQKRILYGIIEIVGDIMNKNKIILVIILSILLVINLFILCFLIVLKNFNLEIGDSKVELPVFSSFDDGNVEAKIFNKKISITKEGNVDTNKVGIYKVKYTCKFNILKREKIKTIYVVDKVAPSLNIVGEKNLTLYKGDKYNELGAIAIDNYDGNITKNIKINSNVNTDVVGTYKVEYSVLDSSNNKSNAERTINIVERTNEDEQINPLSNNYEYPLNESLKNVNIYLTFDDGPSITYTPRVLDLLKKYNAKVTFFVTSLGSNELIKREYDEGHTIGLHTYSHSYSIYSSCDSYFDDLNKIDEKVFNAIGIHSKLIRFPGGSSNTISKKYCKGIMSYLAQAVQNKGYSYWDWNILSGDAGKTKDPNEIYNNVISGVTPNKTNVVLLHDIHSYTIDALEPILIWGTKNECNFKAIDTNLTPVHHKINN